MYAESTTAGATYKNSGKKIMNGTMLYRKQIQGSECIANIGPVNPKEWRCRLRQQYKYLKQIILTCCEVAQIPP